MPILDPDDLAPSPGFAAQRTQTPELTWRPTWGEAFEAANELGVAGSLAQSVGGQLDRAQNAEPMDGYDPFTELSGTPYAEHANEFIDAVNPAQAEFIKRKIDREQANRATLAMAGPITGLSAQFAAGAVDPLVFATFAPLTPLMRGKTLLDTTARVAGVTGAGTAVDEAALGMLQATRTLEESAVNVALATAFGGVLGAGGHALEGVVRARLADRLTAEVSGIMRPAGGPAGSGDPASLSAAAARATSPLQEEMAGAFGAEKLTMSPLGRTRNSSVAEVRRISGDLAETPFFLKGNDEGVASATAVETLIKEWQYPLADALGDMDDAFLKYRTGKPSTGPLARGFRIAGQSIADVTGPRGEKLDYQRFKAAVADAMRNGDAHDIPEVAAAAKAFRKKLFDPLKDEAIALGLLPEGVEVSTAASYLSRLYDLERIASNRNGFIETLVNWFETEQLRKPADEQLSNLELREIADRVTDNILKTPPGRTVGTQGMVPGVRGPLKGRVLNVPDSVLQPWLVNDVEQVARSYARTMAADVELTRKFGRPDMNDQLVSVREAYDRMAAKTTDGPKQAELQKQYKRDLRDLEGMRDRIRGTYAMPENPLGLVSRTGRFVRNLNYVRLLGGMTISAIPDTAGIIMKNGFLRVVGEDGVLGLMKNMDGYKLSAAEVRRAGTALDLVLETRAMQMADVFEDFGRYSKFERGMQYLGDKMGGVSLMGLWNANMKAFTGVIVQSRILRTAERLSLGKEIMAGERRNLAMLGVDEPMAGRIAEQFATHGDKQKGAWWANTEAWTDGEARRIYRAAVVKSVDMTIVTPGQDRPLWMSTELGRLLGQFKSFTFSATSKVLINGLQQRDAAALHGAMSMIIMGMLATWLKSKISGREPPKTASAWVTEGVDQSGIVGWLMEANNIGEKLSRNHVGIRPAIGALTGQPVQQGRRYASRSALETLGGPSAGLVQDLAAIAADATGRTPEGGSQFGASDVHKVRKLLPYNNLFYARWLFDRGEEAVDDSFGLPRKAPPAASRVTLN